MSYKLQGTRYKRGIVGSFEVLATSPAAIAISYKLQDTEDVLAKSLFAFIEAISQTSARPAKKPSDRTAGVGGVTKGGLACEFALSESPVSIHEGFQHPARNETGRKTSTPNSSGE